MRSYVGKGVLMPNVSCGFVVHNGAHLTPDQARDLAADLIEAADTDMAQLRSGLLHKLN
jgi:hypothetical protein